MGFINKIKGALGSSEKRNFSFLNNQVQNGPIQLVFDSDITFDSDDNEFIKRGIVLDVDDLIIDGDGHTINANGKSSIFLIKGSNITLKNINFQNASGYAILNDAEDTNIVDCTFENSEGQAIINMNGNLNVSNSTFSSNNTEATGAAIFNKNADLVIFGCMFNYNVSLGPGGALINTRGNVKIDDSNFLNNVSKDIGGALFNLSELEVTNSTFEHNTSRREGKSIYNNAQGNFKVSGCEFSGLIKDELYGFKDFETEFVNCKSKDDEFNLENSNHWVQSQPTKNFAYLNDLIHNGSKEIVLDADILFEESEKSIFPNGVELNVNGIVIDGNGHYISGNNKSTIFFNSGKKVILKNIVFKDVASPDAAMVNWGELDIFDSKFIQNTGLGTGGAIINAGKGILRIHGTDFSNNKSNRSGGAIVNYSEMLIENSKFENNTAKEEAGAIINLQESNLNISNTQFINNNAGSYGLSILNLGNLDLNDSNFTKTEEAEICGISTSVMNKNNCNFKVDINSEMINSNQIQENPLANFKYLNDLISTGRKEIVLEADFTLKDIETTLFPNGIDINTTDLVIDGNGHFINANKKTRIFNIFNGNVIFKNITFKNAFSDKGGAILNNWGNLEFVNCKFENNSSKSQGGAIALLGGNLKLKKCDFIANRADNAGGAIIANENVEIQECNFRKNVADLGGAIYNISNINLIDSKFDTNHANMDGGAINNYNLGTVNIINTYFVNNSAENGGAIFNYNCIKIIKSRFNNNDVNNTGGAILSLSTLKVHQSVFENNISKAIGGAVTHAGTFTEIISSKFIKNKASQTGGAVFCKDFDSSGLFYEDCSFIDNFPNNIS